MPVEFLTDAQAAAYGQVPVGLARVDVERYWHLDDNDRDLLERRRRDHNRIAP